MRGDRLQQLPVVTGFVRVNELLLSLLQAPPARAQLSLLFLMLLMQL